MSYGLKTDYNLGTKVDPLDLNRGADVLQAQLPGAFAALGAGVLGASDLLVESEIAPGRALIENTDGVLIYVEVPGALPVPPRTTEPFLHLALRVPDEIGGAQDTRGTDSRRGAAPVPLLSDVDEEPDALRLATWQNGVWTDTRPKSTLVELRVDLAQLQSDLAYNAAQREIGSVSQRLSRLEGPVEQNQESGVTAAQFRALQNAFNEFRILAQGQIAALAARIGVPGATALADDIDRDLHIDVARLEVEAVINNPPFSLEIPASVGVPGVAGNGEDLGNGLTARDNHSGTTIWDTERGAER